MRSATMNLGEQQEKLRSLFERYSAAVHRGSKFVKITLIIGGAATVAVALAVDIAHANNEVSGWTIAGVAGAALVAIGSAFDAIRETDAAKALVAADRAMEETRVRQQELDDRIQESKRFDKAVDRGLDLYIAMDAMRGAIEQSLDLHDVPVPTIIQTCLSAATNSLVGAFDFDIKDVWTICIFMARRDTESGKTVLSCVAHLRKIPCDLSEARVWPEGVGVAGIAYSMNHEIIISDMSSPDAIAMFDLQLLARTYDKVRYASMAAVPINVGSNARPWGVAVVTSDRASHFSREPSYGVATAEPIRAVAAMAALAVKAADAPQRAADVVAK